MGELIFVGLGATVVGWLLCSVALSCALKGWWLGMVFSGFFGVAILGVGWKATYQAVLVLLGLETARLARRAFRNAVADWLFSGASFWSERAKKYR